MTHDPLWVTIVVFLFSFLRIETPIKMMQLL